MNASDTDRIRKTVVVRAPMARVWRAISDARQFGAWFGMVVDGPFTAGARLTARITPTTVDPEVARLQEPHAGTAFELLIERVEPMRVLAFRWHPNIPDPVGASDATPAPTTLVEFELEAVPDGTRLTITESGFDAIPLARRAAAFSANEHGWDMQLRLVALYLEQTA